MSLANQSPFLGFDRLEVRQGSGPPLVMAGSMAALYFLRLEVDGPLLTPEEQLEICSLWINTSR